MLTFSFRLPLKLVAKPILPVKNAAYKLTVDSNKPPVNLNDIFPGMNNVVLIIIINVYTGCAGCIQMHAVRSQVNQ